MRRKIGGSREDRIEGEESLVPFIEEEERRLEKRLEEARKRAADSVEAAEAAAKRQAEAARERGPRLQEERRREALAEIEQEAERLGKELSDRTKALRTKAEGRVQEAAGVLVELVWPHH